MDKVKLIVLKKGKKDCKHFFRAGFNEFGEIRELHCCHCLRILKRDW